MDNEQAPYGHSDTAETTRAQPDTANTVDREALEEELAQLRREVAENERRQELQRHTGRRWAMGLLIILGCVLLAGGSIALWVRDVVLDTNTWVSTVAPLARNEVVAGTLSAYVVAEAFEAADVNALVRDALPEQYAALSGPMVGIVKNLAIDVLAEVIRSDQFNAVWSAANGAAHRLAMEALMGDRPVLYLQDGKLTVDLTDVLGSLQSALGLQNLELFGGQDAPGKFVLLESRQVAVVQQVLSIINTAGTLLPLLSLASFFVAWLVSLWRRDTIKWIGIGVTITAALSLLLVALAQPVLLATVADPVFRSLADEVWDVVLRGFVWQTVLLGLIGTLIALGAWLLGPGEHAVKARTTASGWFGSPTS